MPAANAITYRIVKRGDHRMRLAFDKSGRMIEAKNLDTGEMHTMRDLKANPDLHKQMMGGG